LLFLDRRHTLTNKLQLNGLFQDESTFAVCVHRENVAKSLTRPDSLKNVVFLGS